MLGVQVVTGGAAVCVAWLATCLNCPWSAQHSSRHADASRQWAVLERAIAILGTAAAATVPAAGRPAAVRRQSHAARGDIGRLLACNPPPPQRVSAARWLMRRLCGSLGRGRRGLSSALASAVLVLVLAPCRRFPGDWHSEELLEPCPNDSRVATLLLANC